MVEMVILRSRYPNIFLYKNHQIQLFLTSNYPNFWFLALTQDPEEINTAPLYPLCTLRQHKGFEIFLESPNFTNHV